MDRAHLRRGAAAALLLAAPTVAQEPRFDPGPPPSWPIAPAPDAGPGRSVTADGTERPGLFGWRRRHAERKRHLQEKLLGYPEEFNEWPLGSALYAQGRTMVANGEAARLTFYDYDFVGNTDRLNDRGLDKLAAVAARLPASFDPVIVERTPRAPDLAERRRLALLESFATGPFPVPPERVVVGRPSATPLRGVEAQIINLGRLSQTYSDGTGGGVGGQGITGNNGFDTSGVETAPTQGQ